MVEIAHIVRPTDLNSAKRLFGGTLMAWIDETAVIVAKRHAMMNVTTASVDNLSFLSAARMRDVIVIIGKITYVGTTSMEVKVESFVEHINGERELVNRAYITMVGLDDDGVPAKIPELILETPEEIAENEQAKVRRKIRSELRNNECIVKRTKDI
ncbi:MAG: acyl-CoA thioesterase [Lachnospiraceae bacterium]|nr:acyl-CoA thioesterase [Lachnospiraceae bacterium]MBP3504856.1 acyl-CoA thioesterase [Lachnospiraceae bacterium]